MKKETLMNALKGIKNGSFFRVMYETEVPVKAAFKKLGYTVEKTSNETVRTGVSYGNMESTKRKNSENEGQEKPQRVNNSEWIVKDKISYNTQTGNYYFHVCPVPNGNNQSSEYVVRLNGDVVGHFYGDEEFKKSELVDCVLNSYFKKEAPSIKKINVNHIVLVNEEG